MKGSDIFTSLAQDYGQFRPGYPSQVVDLLTGECQLCRDWVIADIGSGTGNLAKVFLDTGHRVIGVEPNCEMRELGERLLSGYADFRSLQGSAECIPLYSQSVNLITVGQAIHWFDVENARMEFRRILRPGGWVAVAWNERRSDVSPFTREYDALTRSFALAQRNGHGNISLSKGLDTLFADIAPKSATFLQTQQFDIGGLLGRARSSGFIPQPGATGHEDMTVLMTDLFHRHQQDGFVEFQYSTKLFFGQLT